MTEAPFFFPNRGCSLFGVLHDPGATAAPRGQDREVSESPAGDRKVNLMIVASGLGVGGAEVVMRDLALTLDRRLFNVSVCCLRWLGETADALARAGVDVTCLAKSPDQRVDYLTSIKLLRLIKAKQIDAVHTHTTNGLVDAGICKLLRPRLKVIHTFHFGNYPRTEGRIRWIERAFSRVADRLVAVGEVQRRQLLSAYRFQQADLAVVHNGVNFVSGTGAGSFRARVGGENRILIGTIATLIEQKGLRDLLAVAHRFRDAGDKVRFVVVGDGHLRPELEAMRRKMGLDDTVVFTGWVPDAAESTLPDLDVFFQPSLWEAMSVVVLEAMAAGKPIVATRVGETPEILEDGVDALLVERGDIGGMAAALGRLIDDPCLRSRLGRAARQKSERFTVANMTRAYERVYLGLA